MDSVDKPQNYKDLYGILQTLRGSHLNNFPRKFLKPDWVAFHSVTFQLKCLDFQSNQYKELVPVLSRFCNCLLARSNEFASKWSRFSSRRNWKRFQRSWRWILEEKQLSIARNSLRSKRSRTKRTKFGPRVLVFHTRDARKMGREQKGPPPSFHLFALAPFYARPESSSSAADSSVKSCPFVANL